MAKKKAAKKKLNKQNAAALERLRRSRKKNRAGLGKVAGELQSLRKKLDGRKAGVGARSG